MKELPSKRERGVTLIEMVIVLLIFSMLLGLSVAMFRHANRDLGVRAASGHLIAMLRHVRDFARSEGVPAWVVIDLNKPHSFYSLAPETVGAWHLETDTNQETPGALGRNAKTSRVRPVPGRVGYGFEMGSASTIQCGDVPVYDRKQGLWVDFWIWRFRASGTQTLCAIGSEFEMRLSGPGRPEAKLGNLIVSAPRDLALPTESWTHLRYLYNGREAQLWVNKVPVARVEGKAEWTASTPLTIGGKGRSLVGIVDEFRVGVLFPQGRYVLPADCSLEFPSGFLQKDQKEYWIHFDSRGRLVARHHTKEIKLKVKSKTAEMEIAVPLTGIVKR